MIPLLQLETLQFLVHYLWLPCELVSKYENQHYPMYNLLV